MLFELIRTDLFGKTITKQILIKLDKFFFNKIFNLEFIFNN